jgi:hypothetical protein
MAMFVLVTVHTQLVQVCARAIPTVEQITNALHVDLKVADFDMEFKIFIHAVDMIEYVMNDTRYDAARCLVTQVALRTCVCARAVHARAHTSIVCVLPDDV